MNFFLIYFLQASNCNFVYVDAPRIFIFIFFKKGGLDKMKMKKSKIAKQLKFQLKANFVPNHRHIGIMT